MRNLEKIFEICHENAFHVKRQEFFCGIFCSALTKFDKLLSSDYKNDFFLLILNFFFFFSYCVRFSSSLNNTATNLSSQSLIHLICGNFNNNRNITVSTGNGTEGTSLMIIYQLLKNYNQRPHVASFFEQKQLTKGHLSSYERS